MNEELKKSVDALLDELFEEKVEKSDAIHEIIGEPKQAKGEQQKAEVNADQVKPDVSSEEDEKAGKKRGRPDDLSQMSMRSPDGESKGSYDASITSPAQVPQHQTTIAKSETSETSKEIEELKAKVEELTKAINAKKEEDAKVEELKKAEQEKADLIKSEVEKATADLKKENDELKKSIQETADLVKAIAKKPKPRQSISSVDVLEKSAPTAEQKHFSKSEMLDAAEQLFKAKKLTDEDVIELEDTGFIYNEDKRRILEEYLQGKK